MLDLVGNPEDRFYHNEGSFVLWYTQQLGILPLDSNFSRALSLNYCFLATDNDVSAIYMYMADDPSFCCYS